LPCTGVVTGPYGLGDGALDPPAAAPARVGIAAISKSMQPVKKIFGARITVSSLCKAADPVRLTPL